MSLQQWVGVALLMMGLLLYFSDLDVDLDIGIPALDLSAVVGGACVVLGAFLMFPDPRVGLGVLVAASVLVTARMVVRYRITRFGRHPSRMQALTGQTGYATTPLEPRGSVQVESELWSAVSDSGQPIEKGAEIVVLDVDGLTLKVFEAPKTGERTGG